MGNRGERIRQNISQPQEKKGGNKNLNDMGEITIKQENFQNYKTTLNNYI